MDSSRFSNSTEALAAGDQEDIELTEMSDPSASSIHPIIKVVQQPMATTASMVQSPLMLHRPNGLAFEIIESDFEPLKYIGRHDVKPTKAEVLHYFVQADTFCINRINHDMQITDEDGYPLFDAWVEVDFWNRVWRVEAYGKLVLSMQEPLSWCSELTRMRIPMRDWNGDFFGALVPGDPFLILSAERQVVAKLIPHRTPIVDTEGDGDLPNVVVAPSVGIPTKPCWLCVLEGSGRHIARLEDYQFLQFNKDVAFQLKLLTLAAVIRLVGQLNPVNNFLSVVKYVFNCCANGY